MTVCIGGGGAIGVVIVVFEVEEVLFVCGCLILGVFDIDIVLFVGGGWPT